MKTFYLSYKKGKYYVKDPERLMFECEKFGPAILKIDIAAVDAVYAKTRIKVVCSRNVPLKAKKTIDELINEFWGKKQSK